MAKNDEPIGPKKGRGAGPRPNRQKQKKQITVRLNEDLLRAALAAAESDGLRLTDAIEDGLWLWIQRKRPPELFRQVRLLANALPLDLQRLTLSFWAFCCQPSPSAYEEMTRKYLENLLQAFAKHPTYEEGLHAIQHQVLPGENAGPARQRSAETLARK
jgi:hypothetical protein